MPDRLRITIGIPTHNRSDLLGRTLESIAAVRPAPDADLDVVVVANACTDDTPQVVEAWAARSPYPMRCVAESKVGLGHARNRAATEATGDIVALTDDDIWMAPGWLEATADAYLRRGADLVAGHVELWWEAIQKPAWMTPGAEIVLSKLELGDHVLELKTPDVIGANFSFRKSVFDRSGPFRTDIDRIGGQLLAGGETFFCRSALDDGFRLLYVPGASVKHWVSPHRVQEKYIRGVNVGIGITLVILRKTHGPAHIARDLVVGGGQVVAHGLARAVAKLRRDDHCAMHHLVRASLGRGRLLGSWARLKQGPLARPAKL